MKYLIKKFLISIRRFLTIVKTYCLPIKNEKSLSLNSYEKFYKECMDKSYNHFKNYFDKSVFIESNSIIKYAIEKSLLQDKEKNKYYLEFGVFQGMSINVASQFVKKIYGFDSFEGLREDWYGTSCPQGTCNLNKKVPKLNKNVILVVGWIQDTLEEFLKKNNPEINFVHIDVDTYETTKFILKNIKPFLLKKSIILFDELYDFPGWEVGEYKALKEVFSENDYQIIAFAKDGCQVAIQLK